MANRTIRTFEKGERLLKALAQGKSISAACRSERIYRQRYYEWRTEDPDFAAKADAAIEEGTDLLEDRARERAFNESDTLMIFLLKARRPETYRERSDIQLTGANGAPFTINLVQSNEGPP